ncbi:MAG: STAS domain-containing protein [Phycisphaerales bacterium]|jgi:anti-anti-sigma factor|nr:STAS domain-containing protein [Phycisphaerales bacterium]MBT7170484.1 STAS domain-containing protein [Phycisphaerales bacterium]
MSIQDWSDNIIIVDLADDPQYTEDLDNLMSEEEAAPHHVVLNFQNVTFINSSNIAHLLRVRKGLHDKRRSLSFCCLSNDIKGLMKVTGLDLLIPIHDSVAMAIAQTQVDGHCLDDAE